ncbi:hypothetical protein ACWC2K_19185 [Streptomyces chattanoogensis]|uniref:hypothetical protein n=1 Tax=Streptomyces chattanoogensis TaxID=66876 RepID=UPI0036AE8E1C
MTPSLEWTEHLPAAVSAVHALGALVRLYWDRGPVAGKARRSRAAEGPRDRECHCRCDAGVPIVRVNVAAEMAEVPVAVRVAAVAGPGESCATAGEEPGPW